MHDSKKMSIFPVQKNMENFRRFKRGAIGPPRKGRAGGKIS